VAIPLRRGAGARNTIVQTEAVLRIGTNGFAVGAEVRPVPVAVAAFGAATTIISGLRSARAVRCCRSAPGWCL
jgi:hypothetical protein